MKLVFGTAGIPIATEPRNTVNGVETVRKLGLDAMELEFVHSVNISKDMAPLVHEVATKNDVKLTCHGQYYINLNSDATKTKASVQRVLNAARVAWLCGGWSVCFHAGYYMGQPSDSVYDKIKKQLMTITKTLRDEGNKIWIRPEISGKATQFGSLGELIKISEIDGVLPCVDFSHLHARTNGKYNTKEEFKQILETIERHLGRTALDNMHVHLSGINYGPKGEKNHLTLKESDMNYKDLIKTWKEFRIGGVVIGESPNIENDALLMKKTFEKL